MRRLIYGCILLLSFTLIICPFVSANSEISWNTFLGSSLMDIGSTAAADGSGNLYVTGYSETSWGSPINAHSGETDAFVAKLNSSGDLQWHTFLGSSSTDYGYSVAADSSGNLYVAGYSESDWGSPINPYAGEEDVFVAKLDGNGLLHWHTFLGSSSSDWGFSVAADSSGILYVTGSSEVSWGSPINAHAGGAGDTFIAKLDSGGILQWHTYLGSSSYDTGNSIVAGGDGNLFITGSSNAGWGLPINSHTGSQDAFVAKLDSNGVLQWHTFFGSSSNDSGHSGVVDGIGNLYVTGRSDAGWGSPINAHTGGYGDVFVTKLDSSGMLQWHTFLGYSSDDSGNSVVAGLSGNFYVIGWSGVSFSYDAFVTKIYDLDIDDDGWPNDSDGCPHDLYKSDPGVCGCGVADRDTDDDGTPDCNDNCSGDHNKINPGTCGCGEADTDSDIDGTPDCNDSCPEDSNKTVPGICGCGVPDIDTDNDGTADCIDSDDDGDGRDDSMDAFPSDPDEWADNDQDGIGDTRDKDDDNDGCEDSIERAGPQNGDGNADGIADSLQNNVTTLKVLDGQQYCTLELPTGHRFARSLALSAPPADAAPASVNFEYGYFDFTIGNLGPGQSTTVTLYLPAGAAPTTYYKYGKTPDKPSDHWYEFLYDGQTGAEINGNIITLYFVDGQRGDDILTQDRMVVDVGGPGFEDTAATDKSGSGGGCFITSLPL